MSRPAVGTTPLTRDKIAQIVGQRPELIRALERVFEDIADILPDSVEAVADVADDAAADAATALTTANTAASDATAAQAAADAAAAGLAAHVAALNPHPQYQQPLSGVVAVTVPALAYDHEQTVAVTGMQPSMRVVVSVAPHSDADENHETMLSIDAIAAQAQSGSLALRMGFGEPTSGLIRINYMAV